MVAPRWLWCCALLCSTAVMAQSPAPGVMPFPLEIKRTPPSLQKEDRESLQREYTRLLRLGGAQVPDFVHFDFALRELKRQDCEREDECLAQLAKKAESLYALYASLDYTLEGAVWVSGRVVRDDGKVVRPTQIVKMKEGEFKDDAIKALTQLFEQLKLSELPAERPVEATVSAATPVPSTVAPPEVRKTVESSGEGQRSAGRAVVIVGAVGAVAGGALLAVGQVMRDGVTPDANHNLPLEQLSTFQTARTLSTGGLIAVGAGGATALVGALIWGLAPSAPVKVSAVAAPGTAVMSVQGEF